MSCSAVVSPASPTTYAVPPGRWSSRNCAVASAEVQIASTGTSMPLPSSRARRSRGVKIELFVSTRKRRPEAWSAWMNSCAPGIGISSCTSTPSMSVSQVSTGRVMGDIVTGLGDNGGNLPTFRASAARQQHLDAVGGVLAGDSAAQCLDDHADLGHPVHALAVQVLLGGAPRAEDRDPKLPGGLGVED